MKISFDLDGVLWPWTFYAHDYCIQNGYTNLSIEDFFETENHHSPTFWFNLVRIPMLYYKAPMKESYKALLNKLASSGWEIFYITNRPEECKAVTYNWLEDAKVPFLKNIIFTNKKSIPIRYHNIIKHIDDRKSCIEEVKNFCASYLVNTYWNRNYQEPFNCKRINSILDLEKELLNELPS